VRAEKIFRSYPSFNPEKPKTSLKLFLADLERNGRAAGMDDAALINAVTGKLEGPAREHIGETLFLRWESFKTSLLERFQMNSIAATDKLREIRKGKNQTVDAYAEEFRKLRSLAFPANLSPFDKDT